MSDKNIKQINGNHSTINVRSIEEQFLENLTVIIEDEISNVNMNIEFICKEIGLSHSQLNRKLKDLTDYSITQFIRSVRLKKAAYLIQNKSASIREIALSTGFESILYFTTKFKEEFGKLPTEY